MEKDSTTLKVTIIVTVEHDLNMNFEDVIDEFSQESAYNFDSTDNVKVVNQEFRDCQLN